VEEIAIPEFRGWFEPEPIQTEPPPPGPVPPPFSFSKTKIGLTSSYSFFEVLYVKIEYA